MKKRKKNTGSVKNMEDEVIREQNRKNKFMNNVE
jgi:hypothetical protein